MKKQWVQHLVTLSLYNIDIDIITIWFKYTFYSEVGIATLNQSNAIIEQNNLAKTWPIAPKSQGLKFLLLPTITFYGGTIIISAYLHLYTQHSSSGPHITSLKIFREYEIVIFFSLERKFSNTSIIIRSLAHATTVRQSSTVLRTKNCPLSHYL